MTRFIVFIIFFGFSTSLIFSASIDPLSTLIKEAELNVNKGNLNEAISLYKTIKEKYKDGADDPALAKALLWGGNTTVILGYAPDEAFEYYLGALELSKKHNDINVRKMTLCSIGILYGIFHDYEQAVTYFEKALSECKSNETKSLKPLLYVNLAYAYGLMNNKEKTEYYLNLEKNNPVEDPDRAFYHLQTNLGIYYGIEKNYSKSKDCLFQALGIIDEKIKDDKLKASTWLEIAKIYEKSSNPDSAYFALNQSLKFSGDRKMADIHPDIYKQFVSHFRNQGLTDSIYKYQTLFYEISDSLLNSSRFNNAKDTIYKYEERETSDTINDLKERIVFLVTSAVLALLILLILILYSIKERKAKRFLLEKNNELFNQIETINKILKDYNSRDDIDQANEQTDGNKTPDISENDIYLLKKIQEVMNRPEIISDPEFSLSQLSQLVNSNTSYVSAVINDTLGKNFKTYLNEHRIHEAIKKLENENSLKFTMGVIAQEVGFKTQNNFIVNFKKVMGMTPSEYKKLISKSK